MVGGVVLSASKAMESPIPRCSAARGPSAHDATILGRLRRPEWCRSVPGRKLVPGSIRSSAEIVPRSKAQGRALADRQIGTPSCHQAAKLAGWFGAYSALFSMPEMFYIEPVNELVEELTRGAVMAV